MQMNNPMQFIQAIRNPQQFIENMLGNNQIMQNPMMKNAINMYRKGDVEGLQKLTENIASQHGTNVDEIRKQIGI